MTVPTYAVGTVMRFHLSPEAYMSDGIPFKSRYGLQWQLVLVSPGLLRAAQRRLRASGPSHAIEEALRLAVFPGHDPRRERTRPRPPSIH